MNGLDIARRFWEEVGQPVLERDFPDLLPRIAVGLCGSGSECFGFDDAVSRDHDFEPGFCLFLPGEDVISRREEFLLERAYAKLPREFLGLRRSNLSPVGGNRHGPIRASRFWTEKLGRPTGELSREDWFRIPDYALAEAVNGEVFRDDSGFFTRVRENLVPPEDVVKKKLAAQFFLLGQAGQYNVPRCLSHGETGAALLAAGVFVRAALRCAFLIHNAFQPYYKWSFRALRSLPGGMALAPALEEILRGGPDTSETIEAVCGTLADLARRRWPSLPREAEMEKMAYAVNDAIGDGTLRNTHILYALRDES